mgnify:CR=1 FL=1
MEQLFNKNPSHIQKSNTEIIDLTEEEDIDHFLFDQTENQIIIENIFSSYERDIKDNDLEVNNSPIKLKSPLIFTSTNRI